MRSFALSVIALVAPFLANAAPIMVRQSSNSSADILVLQFADVLEQLESEFYGQALMTFSEQDFINAGFADAQIPIQQIEAIASDEQTHDTFLQTSLQALGAAPISNCQFDFSSVLTDVTTMAATARVVENLGVAAYLGASTLITDPSILVSAASILTVEARHQTVLNILNGGTAIPQAFDIAFTPSEVLATASSFISGCEIPITANTNLQITNTGTVTTGTALTFASSALNSSTDGLFCQMLVGGVPFSISLPLDQCVVPAGINGPVAIYVTSDDQPVLADVVERNLNTVIAGPTMAFIDISNDNLADAARNGSAAANSTASSVASSAATPSSVVPTSATVMSIPSSTPTATSTPVSSTPTVSPTSSVPVVDTSGAPVAVGTVYTTISPSQASAIISGALSAMSSAWGR